jgi:hypothetical protein
VRHGSVGVQRLSVGLTVCVPEGTAFPNARRCHKLDVAGGPLNASQLTTPTSSGEGPTSFAPLEKARTRERAQKDSRTRRPGENYFPGISGLAFLVPSYHVYIGVGTRNENRARNLPASLARPARKNAHTGPSEAPASAPARSLGNRQIGQLGNRKPAFVRTRHQ